VIGRRLQESATRSIETRRVGQMKPEQVLDLRKRQDNAVRESIA
jgi:hypothetical protein